MSVAIAFQLKEQISNKQKKKKPIHQLERVEWNHLIQMESECDYVN